MEKAFVESLMKSIDFNTEPVSSFSKVAVIESLVQCSINFLLVSY